MNKQTQNMFKTFQVGCTPLNWATPFEIHTPPVQDLLHVFHGGGGSGGNDVQME